MTTTATQLAGNLWRIPTTRFDLVNSYALLDEDGQVTLVDCGLKSAPARIVAGLAAFGKTPADVTRIVLTHAHPDHAGGAVEMSRRTSAPVAIHADDAPHAGAGTTPPRDATRISGRLMNRLPGAGFPAVEVGEELTDGQLLPIAGGLRVIHTPGHSHGHVSLLHEQTGVLITGDAIWNVLRRSWGVKAFCTDVRMTMRTAQRLADLDYTVAAFTHGPEIRERARERVRGFLARHISGQS